MAKKKKNIKSRLIHHYRWMLVDDSTRESKFSMRITILNLLLIFAFLTTLLFGLAYVVLKYSPMKSYFVDETITFDQVKSQKEILRLNEKIIAIEDTLSRNNLFLEHLQKVVAGDLKAAEVDSLMSKRTPVLVDDKSLKASAEDSLFRAQIAQEELESLKNTSSSNSLATFYPPVRGIITGKYSISENHLATDIAAPIGESVKAVTKGIVVFSGWNPDTGNTLILKHDNDVMTMYKHCAKVFKEVGDEVGKGDVIASVGNTGELTTGPHLHFELWIQGHAVDAEDYIEF